MGLDLGKYALKELGNVAEIITSATFKSRLEKGDFAYPEMTFIHVPKKYTPKKMEVEVMVKPPRKEGYVVFAKNNIEDNIYLSCILNSHVAWLYLTNGNLDSKTSISKKKLGSIPVRLLSTELQVGVVYLYYLIGSIMMLKDKGVDNPILEFREDIYRELLDGIVLELTMPDLFEEFKIDLFFSWCALMSKCSAENPGITYDDMQEIIGKEMMDPQSFVTYNMKKLRVVVQKISEKLVGKV